MRGLTPIVAGVATWALITGGLGPERDRTRAALDAQELPPDRVLTAPVQHAPASREWDWLWLVEASVAPEPGALRELLAAAHGDDAAEDPVLLAGRVATPGGPLHPASLPVVEVLNADAVLAALDRRLLALRVARPGSVLVHRKAFDAHGPPEPAPLGFFSWTARVLRSERGLLVPSSVAIRHAEAGPAPHAELTARLRLLRSEAFAPRERPWFAFQQATEAVRAVRRAGRAAQP